MSDYRDLALVDLASAEAGLREDVVRLEADVMVQREIAKAAIHALAQAIKDRDAARRRLYALLDRRAA